MTCKKDNCQNNTEFFLYFSGSVILSILYDIKEETVKPKRVINENIKGKIGLIFSQRLSHQNIHTTLK